MVLGLLFVGVLAGSGAAALAFGQDFSLFVAVLAYAFCSMGAVLFTVLIWAMTPTLRAVYIDARRPNPQQSGRRDPRHRP